MSRPLFAKPESDAKRASARAHVEGACVASRFGYVAKGRGRATIARSSGLFGQGVGEVIVVSFGIGNRTSSH
jgi:hypothetical protein